MTVDYVSGWCGTARHDRCLGAYAGTGCTCPCHTRPEVVIAADMIAASVIADVSTDTLRDALRIHHPIMRSETGPFSGCRCGQVRLGQDVIAHVVTELRAALDGPR